MNSPHKYIGIALFCLFTVWGEISVAQTFRITGQLLDAETKESIEEAAITLKNTLLETRSIGGGMFALDQVVGGKYTLSVTYPGFNRYEKIINLEGDLNLGQIELIRYGSEGTGAALQKTIRSANVSRLLTERPNFIGGNMVYGIPPEPKRVEGNFYLDQKWNIASILLYRDQEILESFRVRYQINANQFELLDPETFQVTTLQGYRVQNIVWMDSSYNVPRYFVNGMDFKEDGVPISGFFEVLVEGQLPLMRRTLAVFKESNYNVALMVGNRNDQIVKRNSYYYLKGKDLILVPKKRKQFFTIFGKEAAEVEQFFEENQLKLSDPSAIFQVFTYYNSKFPGFVPIMTQLLDESITD